MTASRHELVFGVREADGGVGERFAEFVAGYFGVDGVADDAAGGEVCYWFRDISLGGSWEKGLLLTAQVGRDACSEQSARGYG